MFRIIVASALLAVATAGNAQVTTCYAGERCEIEEADGKKRELSPAEVSKIMRRNSRTALDNVQCKHATDQERCEKMLSELWGLFPL